MAPVEFHPLRVVEVTPLTDDSVVVSFDVPPVADPGFRVPPRTARDASSRGRRRRPAAVLFHLRQRQRRQAQSRHQTPSRRRSSRRGRRNGSRAGEIIGVMPPVGEFTIEPDPSTARHRVAIVAGSGITPVLSLVATTLESEPGSSWTVIFGNRTVNSCDVPRGVGGTQRTATRPVSSSSIS